MYDVSARSVGSVKSKRIPSGSDLRKELKTLATNLRRCESVQRALRDGIHAVEEKMTEVAYRQMPDTKPDYFDAALWEPKGWQPRALSKRSRRKPRSRLKK